MQHHRAAFALHGKDGIACCPVFGSVPMVQHMQFYAREKQFGQAARIRQKRTQGAMRLVFT